MMKKDITQLIANKTSSKVTTYVGIVLLAVGLLYLGGCAPTPPPTVVEDAPVAFQSN